MSTDTTINLATRLDKLYYQNEFYLTGTAVQTALTTFKGVLYPAKSDIDTLRASIYGYQDSIGYDQLSTISAANDVLVTAESAYVQGLVGGTSVALSSNLATEHAYGISYAKIVSSIKANIVGQTTAAGLASAIALSIGGISASVSTDLITTLTTAINAGDDSAAIATLVTNLSGRLTTGPVATAANIAAIIYDGVHIVDSSPSLHTDRTAITTDISNYFSSDITQTVFSVIGAGDFSAIGTSLSAALGTPTVGLLNIASKTVTAAIGETSLPTIGVTGSATAATSLSDGLSRTNTALGTTDISKIAASLSAALGTPSTGLLNTVHTTVTSAIGETALPTIGVTGSATAATSLSDGLSRTNTALGTTDISKIGASLSAALGTPTVGLLHTASKTVTAAIGEVALSSTVAGTSMTTSSISGWLSDLATVVGIVSNSDIIYTTASITVKRCGPSKTVVADLYSVSSTVGIYPKDVIKACANYVKVAAGADLYLSCTGLNSGCTAKLDPGTFLSYCLDCWDGQ